MALIIDADVIIRGEKGLFDIRGWLGKQTTTELELCAITVAELWHGVERATGRPREAREAYLATIVEKLPILPYTEQTAYHHARIWAESLAAGKMIGYYDLIVAATAIEHGSQVATFNKKHFSRITGLRIVEPST